MEGDKITLFGSERGKYHHLKEKCSRGGFPHYVTQEELDGLTAEGLMCSICGPRSAPEEEEQPYYTIQPNSGSIHDNLGKHQGHTLTTDRERVKDPEQDEMGTADTVTCLDCEEKVGRLIKWDREWIHGEDK